MRHPLAICSLLFALAVAAALLPRVVDPEPAPLRLALTLTILDEPAGQPAAGLWNPATGELAISADAGAFNWQLVCGPAIALTWTSQPGMIYECQASQDLRSWTPCAARIVGSGQQITVYDWPRPGRFYRLAQL